MDVALDETRENVQDLQADGDGLGDQPDGSFSLRTGGRYDVTLTLPNGRRTTFYYSPVTSDGGYTYRPSWQSEPGVTAKLGVQGQPVLEALNGFLWYEADDSVQAVPYDNIDFEGFILTTLDGTQYFINREDLGNHSAGGDMYVETFGKPYLAKIVQRSGDTITINPNSIIHNYANGGTNQIVFQRNADGLITSISDPSGLSSGGAPSGPPAVLYQYDSNDNLINVLNLVDRTGTGTYVTNSFSYTNVNFPHFITGIFNANGAEVAKNFYDDSGKLTTVTDANGNTTKFIHNLTNDLEVVVDRLSHTNTYVYDLRGNVLAQTNALGQATVMGYDVLNNKTNDVTFLNGAPYATNSYAYDTNLNLMVSSTDPLGHTNAFGYDAYGELTNSTDALGNPTANAYDPSGNLTSTVDALGNPTVNSYNHSFLMGSQDAIGTLTANSYDSYGNLSGTVTFAADGVTILSTNSFIYDADGNRTNSTVWRHVGSSWIAATTVNIYDAQSRVTQTINPDGGTNTVIYNAIGKQQATIDPLGNTNSYNYDVQGRLIQTTYPDGTTESSTYDANGNRNTSTDRAGRVTTYVYDALNRLTQTVYPDNTTNMTAYDDVGRVAKTTDARGTVTGFNYDAAGRRLAVTNAVGTSVASTNFYNYDPNGNQVTFTDANNHTTTNVFDALNRQVQVEYADGTKTFTGYDADGRRVSETNQDNVVTRFGYDGAGRLTSVTNALLQVTRYQYDEVGNEIAQIDALNRTNLFVYDSMGRRARHVLPGNQSETFGYDFGGNLIYTTNFNGMVITNQYDVMNRLTNVISVNNYEVSYAYGPTGQRTNMTDVSGVTIYTYDNRDRLVLKILSNPVLNWEIALSYGYDANGNLTNLWSSHYNNYYGTITYSPYGGVTNCYQYDPLNRLTNVLANGSPAAGYGFDPAGNLQSMQYANGITDLYQYDSLNRLTNSVWNFNAYSRAKFTYQLGLTGSRTNSIESFNGGTPRSYGWNYDNLYRLTNETISAIGSLGYGLDAVGNRTNRTSSYSGLALQTPTYNSNDWLSNGSSGDYYDANGNTTNSGTSYYQYDVMNHLINFSNGSVQISYIYDGDGNRVSKTGTNGVSTYYLIDDRNPSGYAQVLEESTLDIYGNILALTVVYNYGISLISQQQMDDNDTITNVIYYGFDGHGSVRFLTDTSGSITDTYTYDAYGNLVNSTGTTVNNYLYAGQQYDSDLGLYYNRARYLNPNTGRFWSMDSYEGNNEDPLSLHKYLYGEDNPVNRIDPSGHDDLSLGSVLAGSSIGAGIDGAFAGVTTRAFSWAAFRTITAAIAIGAEIGGDRSEAVNYVYRRLSHAQAATPYMTEGIFASNPLAANVTPTDHIDGKAMGGSPWISTSREAWVPLYKYDDNPNNPIVAIDLRKVTSPYLDFTNPGLLLTLQTASARVNAAEDAEVLIYGFVPGSAIVTTTGGK